MAHRTGKRGPRGLSLVELMIAMTIMLIAMIGFVGAMQQALNSTAAAHRRTEATLLRTGLMERLSVTRRSTIDGFAGAGWMAESCYDVNANLLGTNTAFSAGYACPAGTVYVRHVSATAVPSAAGADQRVWSVAIYVDRTDGACTAATRNSAVGCVSSDLYLTD